MPGTFERYRAIGRRRVQGWVETPTFDVLRALRDEQDRAGVEGAVAEIGVHHGKLFIALQLLAPPGTPAVAIDVFDDQNLNVDRSGRGDLQRFEATVRRWGDWSSVVVVQADSTQLTGAEVRDFAGQPIRWFSVDGGHTEEIVRTDMRSAEDSLAAGGIVIADDVFNAEWPDVSVGTMRFLDGGGSLVPFAIGFNKTYFTHKHHAATYRDAIRRDYAHRWRIAHQTKVFHGFEVEVLWPNPLTPRRVVRRSPAARRAYVALTRRRRAP
jgi:hypothetical protein